MTTNDYIDRLKSIRQKYVCMRQPLRLEVPPTTSAFILNGNYN